MDTSEDKYLVEKLRSGDKASFARLYDIYVSRLWRFIRQYTDSDMVADEIVQETFFRVWTHRHSIDPGKSFKSYLFKISYNLLLKEIRRRVKAPLVGEYMNYVSSLPENSSNQVDYLFFKEELEKIKRELPSRQKEIFELIKEYGLSVKQVSKRLSIKEQVVRNQLSSALKTIRLHFGHLLLIIILFHFI